MLKQSLRNNLSKGQGISGIYTPLPSVLDGGLLLTFMEAQSPYLFTGVITFPQVESLGAQIGWGQRGKSRKGSWRR